MSLHVRGWVAVIAVAALSVGTLWAQQRPIPGQPNQPNRTQPRGPGNQGQQGQGQNRNNNNQNNQPEEVRLDDQRLIELHKQFIDNVEKLATEYEKKGELEKARHCYEQVLRLIPQYTTAKDKLDGVKTREATAERKVVDVFANKEWQDSGITIGEGKPVSIKASGQWKIRIDYDLAPDGVEIPKELRDFNLGALVGMIVTDPNSSDLKDNPVFLVGSSYSFTAKQTGRLYLRMYDADPKDNLGKLSVEITGSFEKKGPAGS